MKLKYIMASFLIGSCAFISSCKDDFADINTNPTIVSKPDPRYLFTQALANFDGHDYFAWYYDYNNMLRWSQTVILSTVLFCNPLLMEITFISSFSKSSKQTPSCTEPSASKDWLRAAQNTRLCCIKLSATLLNFCTVSPS